MGVAIVIGSVRSAQYVSTHEVDTIKLFTPTRTRSRGEISSAAPIPPATPSAVTYATAPATVASSSTGSTALLLTLAFFERS